VKSTIQTLDPTRVRLTVEVPLDELGFDLTRSRDQVAGFRVGRLPFSPIDQRMGATVLPQAVEQAIVTHAFAAAKQHDLRPLGRIEIEVPAFVENVPLGFTATIEVRPPVTLPELSSIAVEVAPIVITDEEIDQRIEALRDRHATVTDVGQRRLPPLDDAFAALACAVETLPELYRDLREQLIQVKRAEQLHTARGKVLSQLVAAAEVQAPRGLVQDEVEHRKQWLVEKLRRAGTSLAEYLSVEGQTEEQLDTLLLGSTTERISSQLVLDMLADAYDIQVTPDEFATEISGAAQRLGTTPERYYRQLATEGALATFAIDIRRGKALALLLRRVTITDTDGAPVNVDSLLCTPGPDDQGQVG